MKDVKHPKGLSLPIVIALVVALSAAAAGANLVILRTFDAIRQIENTTRAFYAAEAGIEDALYELSNHFAGYETLPIAAPDSRASELKTTGARWEANWEINSLADNVTWPVEALGHLPAELKPGQKLIVSLYTDDTGDPAAGVNLNAINENDNGVQMISNMSSLFTSAGSFRIEFRIPQEFANEFNFASSTLEVDNDRDGLVNEDPSGDGTVSDCDYLEAGYITNDEDCDQSINEDGPDDQFVFWRMSDGQGHSLVPKKGCISDSGTGSGFGQVCEKDFERNIAGAYVGYLDERVVGVREDGNDQTIEDFILDIFNENPIAEKQLQLELLLVAPLEHVNDDTTNDVVAFPHVEYSVNPGSVSGLPLPYFTIRSDGYYGDTKQSLTTFVTPRTTTPLFDFTIIQQ